MESKQDILAKARLYVVLDRQVCDYAKLFVILKQAVRAGVDIVQLRDKVSQGREVLVERLSSEGVRVRVIGERQGLQADIAQIIDDAEARTRCNDKLNLTIAFNYGGQDEIVRAARRFAADVVAGKLQPSDVSTERFGAYLDTADLPPPDLLIRTSGEARLSNFMLWQAAYAELVFLDVLWPDFDKAALQTAIEHYCRRERRFGGHSPDAP